MATFSMLLVDVNWDSLKFLYGHRGEYWFSPIDDAKKRFAIKQELLGNAYQFLKPNTEVETLKWGERIIGVKAPIKMELRIKETPPGERGNTAQGGTKTAELETGAKIQVPLFVNNEDVVKVNTETGEYVRRVEKAK